MSHRIDPTADYAFKLLLGTEENKDLLLHFLNGILGVEVPIEEVTLVNPFVPSQFKDDDLTVVDVQARDRDGRLFAVEIQNHVRPMLRPRMVYTLTDLFQSQLGKGGDFAELRPVHAIWLLNQNLLKGPPRWLHHFQLRDREGASFSDHLNLHTVELRRWVRPDGPLASGDQWVYFLNEAVGWDTLPSDLQSPEMIKAMSTLNRIFEKQDDYLRYQSRENFLREQRTLQKELAEDRAELAKLRASEEQERAAKEQALQGEVEALQAQASALRRVEALEAQLRALGVDPG